MTVPLTDYANLGYAYACNGSTRLFAIPFAYDDPSYVVVTRLPAGLPPVQLANPAGFTIITVAGVPVVQTVSTFPTGDFLFLDRATARKQDVAFRAGDSFDADVANLGYDKLQRQINEVTRQLGLTLRVPAGVAGAGLDMTQKGRLLTVSADGRGITYTDSESVTASDVAADALAILQPNLDAAVASVVASVSSAVAAATAAANSAQASATSAASSATSAASSASGVAANAAAAQAAASSASSAASLAQDWAAKRGTTVDGVNYSSAEMAAQAANYAQQAQLSASSADDDATTADASASLARLLASAPRGVPITLGDGSVVFSALSYSGDAADIAKLAASLPVKDVTEGTLRLDGSTPFISSGVLLLAPEDLFWTIHLKNASAVQVKFPTNLWTQPSNAGYQSLAPIRFVKLGAGAVTFAAAAGSGTLDPTVLLLQWYFYRGPTVGPGGPGDAAQDRTLPTLTVPAGSNRKAAFLVSCCYSSGTVTGRDTTLSVTNISGSTAHPTAGIGTGFFSNSDPNRLDAFTFSLNDAAAPTTHVPTFHTPADLLTISGLFAVLSNASALGTPVSAQSPSTGHVDVALTPAEAHGRNVVAFFGQGSASDPIGVNRGTVITGGKTGGTAAKDQAYAGTHELRTDTTTITYTGTEAGAGLATPVLRPTAGLGLTFRPTTVGGGSVLTSDAGHTTLGVANGEAWIEAHSDGTNGYLHGEGLT